tara:strand:- start:578 stop:1075 length:498 start_codon:yes stop_codon:yes gene_type:complete
MDPASIGIALTVANSAMKKITTFYQHGKDLSAMSQEITKWMGAVSDVDNIEKQAKNPSLFRKLVSGKGIEGMAFEALTAKKKLEEDRYQIKQMIQMRYGVSAWNELIAMEGKIRKRLQEEKYAREKFKEKVISIVALTVTLGLGLVVLFFSVYTLWLYDQGELTD